MYGSSFVLSGILYAAGGEGAHSSVEQYDVVNDTWTAVADVLESPNFFLQPSPLHP
jgi:hypothetical protein